MFTKNTIAALSVALSLAVAPAQAKDLKGESGSPGGLTTLVLQMMAKDLDSGDLALSLNTGQTLTRSALKLAGERIDVATMPPGTFNAMLNGDGPYKKNPDQARELAPNLRSLFSFPNGAFHPIVWADSGIEGWDDLKGKRVFVGPPGGTANEEISAFIELNSGLKMGEDYEPIRIGWGAASQAFQDGQFDVYFAPGAVGVASISQLGLLREIRILSVQDYIVGTDKYDGFLAKYGHKATVIEPGTYSGQVNGDVPAHVIGLVMLMAVNKSMSDGEAQALTAAFWNNLEENAVNISLLKPLIGHDPLEANNMPFHPGAVKYFAENGVQVPAEMVGN